MTAPKSVYRGRFAPSPTGPLHRGSLVAALGSYLRARSAGGEWYVRIEDIDPPREVPGATSAILRALEAFGLEWDGEVIYQSQRLGIYSDVLDRLVHEGLAYPCSCSRREIREHNRRRTGSASSVYPGLCRSGPLRRRRRTAHRIRVPEGRMEFRDQELGLISTDLREECGDFVLRRRDGLVAYQLAVVVDDHAQEITEVVRGEDLLDSTAGQIVLQQALGVTTPAYMHLPLVRNLAGQKLSKQTGARAVNPDNAADELCDALVFLGLVPPEEVRSSPVASIISWGVREWPSRIPLRTADGGGPAHRSDSLGRSD